MAGWGDGNWGEGTWSAAAYADTLTETIVAEDSSATNASLFNGLTEGLTVADTPGAMGTFPIALAEDVLLSTSELGLCDFRSTLYESVTVGVSYAGQIKPWEIIVSDTTNTWQNTQSGTVTTWTTPPTSTTVAWGLIPTKDT